jgi:AcrR family transcriptional regulator
VDAIQSAAQRVGVTPPSIYLHFADMDAVLGAVCARRFEKLDQEKLRIGSSRASVTVPTQRSSHSPRWRSAPAPLNCRPRVLFVCSCTCTTVDALTLWRYTFGNSK